MNVRTDLEQRLDLFLADDADQLADHVIDAAVLEIAHTDQRRAWRAPWRTTPMLKYAAVLAATLLVVVGGALLTGGGKPVTTPPSPSVVPSAAPTPSPTLAATLVPQPTPFLTSSLPEAGSIIDDLELPEGSSEWLAATATDLWIPGGDPGTLTRLDAATSESTVIELDAVNQTVAVGDDVAWATRNFENEIVKIDLETNEIVDRIPTEFDIYAIALSGNLLWATIYSEDAPDTEGVLVIDTATKEVLHHVDLGRYGTTGIAIGGGFAWVVANATGALFRVDLETYEVVGQTNVGSSPLIVAYGFDSAWVASRRSNAVFRVGPDGEELARIDMPISAEQTFRARGAYGVSVTSDAVWATAAPLEQCEADPDGGSLVRIDPATNEVTARVQVTCAYGVAAAPDGDVWVTGERLYRVRPGS